MSSVQEQEAKWSLGVGIANGGGTISDMFDPSERA